MRWTLAAAVIGTCIATSAAAETARVWSPDRAVVLHEGPMDVEVRWVLPGDGADEVTAKFSGRTAEARSQRVVMRLGEGDDVSFSMPGHGNAVYRFTREEASFWPMRVELSSGVSVSVSEAETQIAVR